MKKTLLVLLGGSAAYWLTGCVVYMPMQCAAPQITDKKQAEITGSTYLNGRVEVAGTYSPVRHLLVRAAYSNLSDKSKDSTYYRGRQYDLGVGTYWQLGTLWLVGGLAGYGRARSEAGYSDGISLVLPPNPWHYFDARYHKLYGEAYGIYQTDDVFSFGAAYRVTRVDFTTLTDAGAPVDLSSIVRSEPMIFLRLRLGNGPVDTRPVQLQVALGTSASFGYNSRSASGGRAPNRHLEQGRGYTTVGISVFPQCLFRSAQAPVSAPGP